MLRPLSCCLLVPADTGILPVVAVGAIVECCRFLDSYQCCVVDLHWLFCGLLVCTAAVAKSTAAPGAESVIIAVVVVVANADAT